MSAQSALPRATEAQCQDAIIEAARMAGWRVHAERAGQTAGGHWATQIQGDEGYPDLTMTRDGRMLVVELKRKPNEATQAQLDWIRDLDAVPGVRAILVYVPEEQDDLIKFLIGGGTWPRQ